MAGSDIHRTMLHSIHYKAFKQTFEQKIYQIDRKLMVGPSGTFTAKFIFFLLTQENALYEEVSF